MKKNQVEIGATYAAKVSGKVVHVRIEGASQYGGWIALNLSTRRRVTIRSAARLRYAVRKPIPALTVGHISLKKGDKVLLTNQLDPAQNGVRIVGDVIDGRCKDGVNYCRCCGGDVKSVGPLDSRGYCGDCVAEYSKPEYHRESDHDLPDEAEEGEGE